MKRKNTYPTKNTINLAMQDREPIRLSILIPAVLVIALFFTGFSKFAVVDRLLAAYRAETRAVNAERQLEKLELELKDYDKVEREYTRYFSETLRSEKMPLDCMEIFSLLERELMSKTSIGSLSFQENVVSVQITGSTLDEVSRIIESLNQEPSVKSVELFTSNTGREASPENRATTIMTITLQEVETE